MRLLACLTLAAGSVLAQGLEEAIQKSLEFTASGERDWARLRPTMILPQYPMSEMSVPLLVPLNVRSATSRWALVEGAIRVYGSVVFVQQTPILLVLKHEGDRWLVDWIYKY